MLIRHIISGLITLVVMLFIIPFVGIPKWTTFMDLRMIVILSTISYIIPISFLFELLFLDFKEDRFPVTCIFTVMAGFVPMIWNDVEPFRAIIILLFNLLINELLRWIGMKQKERVEIPFVTEIVKLYRDKS